MDDDMDMPEDAPDQAVFVPRPLPQGPRRPGCLPIRLFMLIQLLLSAPYLNSPSVFGCEIK